MRKLHFVVAAAALILTACGKKDEPVPVNQPAAIEPPAAARTAEPEQATETQSEDPDIAKRKAAVAFALAEQEIADTPNGQWASAATASSTYNGAKEQASYSEWQATGAPNVTSYGDVGTAWASKDADAGIEWLQVSFAKPVHATAIKIRQNNAPGAIIKVELIDDQNGKHTIFEGVDETKYPANTIVWFDKTFNKTDYVVTGAKITLATNAVSGWNEIDAVQLVGE